MVRGMDRLFSTQLCLTVNRAAVRTSYYREDGTTKSLESFDLVLRAHGDTNIVLSSGELLADIEIHFTLSTKRQMPAELDRDLEDEDVGFLVHTEGERGEPLVHGAALLPDSGLAAALLPRAVDGTVTLILPAITPNAQTNTPFVWGKNRPHMLRIVRIDLSVGYARGGHGER